MEKDYKEKVRINRSRFSIIFMLLLSVFNFIFVLKDGIIYLPFSSSFSTYGLIFGKTASIQTGVNAFEVAGIVFALLVIGIYFICYLKSKKQPMFLFIAFALAIADTLLLLAIICFGGFDNTMQIFDAIMHLMILFYIYQGVSSAKKTIGKTASNKIAPAPVEKEEELNRYEGSSDDFVIFGRYEGYHVAVSMHDGRSELIINNYICDEQSIESLDRFKLCAIVNGTEFSFNYNKTKDKTFLSLCADGEIFESKTL